MKDIKGKKTTKWLACYLAIAIFVIGFSQNVYAGFVPSNKMMNPDGGNRAEDLQKVQNVLESKMVGERLKQLGFTPEEVQGKLAYLSDGQLHQLAVQLDDLKVGGDAGMGVVILICVVLICAVWLISIIVPW